jgi:L-aspartate oxidase
VLDVLVVGSGVAGLSAAVRLASREGARVGVVTKGPLDQATTRFAQGGIAAVLPGGDEDSTDLHLADTLRAGAGLCDADAVRVLVDEGPDRVHELIALGAVFDRVPGGALDRAREGGHSTARVLHAGGTATGAEVERALVAAVRASAAVLREGHFVVDLVVEGGRCRGAVVLRPDGGLERIEAGAVLLATGGAGQLFSVTTNPPEATGDGLVLALRAGAALADVEFVQFHPTALHHPAMPRPLVSEALRGHGALLRDRRGRRFVDELAPRDVVSRAIAQRMAEEGTSHVWLDATGLESFAERFPNIHAALAEVGLDPARDWLPVAPAAHHLCGGVLTDLDGATLVPGLWAVGEVACTGVHGANRLASNSLLEGMVFAARAVEVIVAGGHGPSPTGALRGLEPSAAARAGSPPVSALAGCACGALAAEGVRDASARVAGPPPIGGEQGAPLGAGAPATEDLSKARAALQQLMTTNAGVVRDAVSLAEAAAALRAYQAAAASAPRSVAGVELAHLVVAATALVEAALAREESRGAHTRSDFPGSDDRFRRRFAHGLAQAGSA